MASTSKPLTNWLDLPSDIIASILCRVNVTDRFENVEKVCTAWRKICRDPAIWRVIKIDASPCSSERPNFMEYCKHAIEKSKRAVDRSQGQLVDLTIYYFADYDLIQYVADRSSKLRRLQIDFCFDVMYGVYGNWNEVLKKFPLLEELNLYSAVFSKEAIESAGRFCPMLKTLKVQRRACWSGAREHAIMICDEFAKAIGENLVNLRHLELIGCSMTNMGLQVILDGCCHLESLNLRDCWQIHFDKDLRRRCLEKIKHLELPRNA